MGNERSATQDTCQNASQREYITLFRMHDLSVKATFPEMKEIQQGMLESNGICVTEMDPKDLPIELISRIHYICLMLNQYIRKRE